MYKLLLVVLMVLGQSALLFAQGTVVDDSFYSEALGLERSVDIYLPEGYDVDDPDTRYPVVYFLHGGGLNHNSYPELITVANTMMHHTIDPMIIVKPNGNTGPYNGWNWWSNSSTLGMIEDYIAIDLVQYIDQHYHSDPRPEKRAIMGHSMGATGAMIIGMHNPDLFSAIVSHTGVLDTKLDFETTIPVVLEENGGSGPFSPANGGYTTLMFADAGAWSPNPDNPPDLLDLPIDNSGAILPSVYERWSAFNPSEIISQFTPITLPDIYFDCGLAEPGFVYVNEAFRDSLTVHQLPFRYEPYEGGHMNMLPQRYPVSLAFLDSVLYADLGRVDRAYADPTYYEPGVGEALVFATTVNNQGHTLAMEASVYTETQSALATFEMFDDGLHGDGQAGDGMYAGSWPVPNAEDIWYVDIQVNDLTAGTEMTRSRMAAFTTIGPVQFSTLDLYPEGAEPVIGETTFLKIWLENNGSETDAVDLTMNLSVDEELVRVILGAERSFPDIAPGESATHGSYVRIEFLDTCIPGENIPIQLAISSGDFEFWQDEFYMAPVANGVGDDEPMVPSDYAIESVWPNPFNASTNLQIVLPVAGVYELAITNIEGRLIKSLISGPMRSGRQLVSLDASTLASGTYYATLRNDELGTRTQKLILCK